MATNRILQLLRSKRLYESLDAAKIAIRNINTASDGEVRLARYQTSEGVKSLLCVYHTNENFDPALKGTITNMPGWTFIEDAQSGTDGINALQEELDNLEAQVGQNGETDDFASGAASGSEAEQVLKGAQSGGTDPNSLTNAVTNVATYITTLDKTADVQNGQVVTTVTQTNGQVAEIKANVKDLQLGGYAKDASATLPIAATDTVNAAFSKVENAIAKNTVSSTDKTVTIDTTGATTDLSVNIDGTTIVADANDGTLSTALKVLKVIPSGTAGTDEVVDSTLPTNVREAYRLVYGSSTTAIGKQIDIYKDSALTNVYLGTTGDSLSGEDSTSHESASSTVVTGTTGSESLNFVYHLENGNYKMEKVDVESFLQESEFGNGLDVDSTNHTVSVKAYDGITVDANGVSVTTGNGLELTGTLPNKAVAVKIDSTNDSNGYLSVSASGVALNGNAIADAIENAATTLTEVAAQSPAETTADGTDFIKVVASTAADGHTNYAVSTQGIKDAIADETDRAQDAEGELAGLVGLNGTEGARSYTSQVTLGTGETAPTTVAGDIDLLDAHVEALDGAAVKSVTLGAAQNDKAISIDNTDAQNPVIGFNLSTAQDNAVDAAFAGGSASNGNILQVKNDGLYLDSTWDCGVY